MQIGFIFSLIFAIIIAVFVLQNGDIVSIDFIFTNVKVSQAIVIFVSAALGAIIVTILGVIRQIKLNIKIKEQNKRIKSLENLKLELEKRIMELTDKINSETVSNTGDNKVINNNDNIDGINDFFAENEEDKFIEADVENDKTEEI